jgi:hypothetical protein
VPLTQQDYLDEIAVSLGAALTGGPVPDDFTAQLMAALAARLPALWAMNAFRVGNQSAPITVLYTKRMGLLELMGQMRQYADATAGRGVLRLQYSQLFKNLQSLYQLIDKELHDELTWARANRRVASGRLLARYPSDARVPAHVPGPGEPVRRHPWRGDPNAERLKGWPWPYGPWPGGIAGLWAWGEAP